MSYKQLMRKKKCYRKLREINLVVLILFQYDFFVFVPLQFIKK